MNKAESAQLLKILPNFNVIENATVYIEKILDNGARVVTRYSGHNSELVKKRAVRDFESIDTYRSPKIGSMYIYQGGYACDVTYYGLD